jgi:hypothetical protein
VNDDERPDIAALAEAYGLAVAAGTQLAERTDDGRQVADAAAPIAGWLMQFTDAGDLFVRAMAVTAQTAAMRAAAVTFGKAWTTTPADFLKAAGRYYDGFAAATGYGGVQAGPAPGPRMMFAIRNLLLAASEPGHEGDPRGWPALLAGAVRYGRSAHPPVTAAEYEDAMRVLFRGDRRAAGAGLPAGPPPGRPGTPGYGRGWGTDGRPETVFDAGGPAALAAQWRAEAAHLAAEGTRPVNRDPCGARLAVQLDAVAGELLALAAAAGWPAGEVSIVIAPAGPDVPGEHIASTGLVIAAVHASAGDAAASARPGDEIHTVAVTAPRGSGGAERRPAALPDAGGPGAPAAGPAGGGRHTPADGRPGAGQ